MAVITLTTNIYAPVEICFNLSRSVELHKISTKHTNETVIAGRTSGLFENGDTVKWQARHFGVYQQLEMKITGMIFPVYFEDCMLNGIFKSIQHKHYFEYSHDATIMKDVFAYEVPYGIAGKMFDALVLNYGPLAFERSGTLAKDPLFIKKGVLERKPVAFVKRVT